MIRLEWLFLAQCFMGILMMIFLHKMNQMKKQIDMIMKEVKAYLTFLEEDTQQEVQQVKREKTRKISKDEVENRLIQAVLKEYFP